MTTAIRDQVSRKFVWIVAAILVAAHVALLVHAASSVAWTADEWNYLGAGRALWTDFGFATALERLHGPLPFLSNQWFLDSAAPIALGDDLRLPARLGMLPFAILLLVCVGAWSRALFGVRGMLVSLTFASLSPVLLGYGALIAVDTAFAAMLVLTLWQTWRHAAMPTIGRAAIVGACLGLTFATKYLAVVFAPFVVLALLVAGWREGRLLGAVRAAAIATLVGWVALHAAYGFAVPRFSEVAKLISPTLTGLATWPSIPTVLTLLPEPFVLGIDYQLAAAGAYVGTFGTTVGGHWAYYIVTLFAKLPAFEVLALVLAFAAPRRPNERLWTTWSLPFLGALVYLSLSKMQLGVRYVLPHVALLAVYVGRAAHLRMFVGPRGPLTLATVGVLLAFLRVEDAPHHLSAFSELVGRRVAMDWFGDSNCDWDQDRAVGAEAIARRWEGIEVLEHDDGPRLGLLGRHVAQRKRRDVRDPSRTYDWLMRFDGTAAEIDRFRAAWLVYEVTLESFDEAIARGDPRAGEDCVTALLAADRLAEARQRLGAVTNAETRERMAALIEQLSAFRSGGREPALLLAIVSECRNLRLFDRALEVARAMPTPDPLLLAPLQWDAGEMPQLRDRLRGLHAERELSLEERFLLAQCEFWSGEFTTARELLDVDARPPAGEAFAAAWEQLLTRAKIEAEHARRLFGG
ncbi:MAG: ArnT family glycosyltransferase [Planctomycetota bacterium]